jgi:AraC-like DNA-binding protein
MTKPDRAYEPHLSVRELFLPPEMEWVPRVSGWSLYQVVSGAGYWLHPQMNQELETGTVLLLGSQAHGIIRASQLGGGLTLQFFNVEPERLTGMITLHEQLFFQSMACKETFRLQIFPPDSPVAAKMMSLRGGANRSRCWLRLQFLQVFIEIFDKELQQKDSRVESATDAKERLREFLKQTPASDLLHLDFSELARTMRCTSRHLSRIFHEVVGMSFRDKHTELRLARARELLATTESKVVDVAMESGFQSLSLFNLVFKRRFGVSPGRWRQKRTAAKISRLRPAAVGKQLVPFPEAAVSHGGKQANHW